MNEPFHPSQVVLRRSVVERIDQVCDRFEAAWQAGEEPQIEDYIQQPSEPERSVLLYQLLLLELDYRARRNDMPTPQKFYSRFPEYVELIDFVFHETGPPEALAETVARSELGTSHSAAEVTPAESGLKGKKLGRFELVELLGRGAFGWVYRAHDPRLDRDVALKIPRTGTFTDEEDNERFSREARAAAQLRHSNIVPVHETGEIENTHYIASDFIEGKTLRHHLKHERHFTRREAASLVARLARALHYAHGKGIVHRDVKPENIMLDADGEPQITDFGLAHREHGESLHTREGMQMGTPAYMSPEQAKGQSHLADARSDMWSLGVMLYELLTGMRPFSGQEAELLVAILKTEAAPPRKHDRSIPKDLETICMKCLAKDADLRYPSCQHLAEDLERFCAGEPILARRQNPVVRVWRKVARRPVLSVLIAAALLLMVVSGLLVARGWQERRSAQQEREVTSLLQDLDRLFNAGDWSPQALDVMDTTVAQLERLAPREAEEARAELIQSFAAAIENQFERAHLRPEDVARLEGWLQDFGQLDAEKARLLRLAFERRLASWETVFDLKAPFSGLDRVFDPHDVQADDDALVVADHATAEEILCTRLASSGRVRLEAVFDETWEQASELGLLLNAVPKPVGTRGKAPGSDANYTYRFVIRTPPPREMPGHRDREIPPPSFSTVRGTSGQFLAEIFRDQSRLERKRVEAADLPAGPLRLTVTKMGNHVQFEVGNLQPAEFWDPFTDRGAERGTFAVQWPTDVRVSRLHGLRQALPVSPSPLEHGDSLYVQGKISQALAAYQQQARRYQEMQTGQEAQYKVAICLSALQRESEADALLERLAGEEGDRWPALAACQLWLRRVRQHQLDDAYVLFESLSLRYRTEQLALLIPSELRQEIVDKYVSQSRSLNLYKPNSNAIRDCERAMAIVEFFESSSLSGWWEIVKRQLLRAYRAAGQEQQALRTAPDLLRNSRPGTLSGVVTEYAWMLRVAGRPEEALQELDRWIAQSPNPSHPADEVLLERGRVLAALGRRDEAEKILEERLAEISPENPGWCYTSAWAMLGFLRQRRGDAESAQQAWKQGLRVEWKTPWFGFRFVEGLILASLTGEMSESDAMALVNRLVPWVAGDLANSSLAQSLFRPELKFIASVVRNTFRRPRGREYAPKIVFRELPFAECVRAPALLVVSEAIRQGAIPNHLTDEQEAVVWKLLEDGYAAVSKTGDIGKLQLLQLGFTWKGRTDFIGWTALAPRLSPQLRGPIAYVMGHRYLRLKRREDAAMFFRIALRDAPPGSSLNTLAQAELNHLAAANDASKTTQ